MVTPEFRPTHVVPQDGLPAWEAPDVSRPTEPLDPLLPVQLIDRRGDWGQILCANGWSAWVDGRLLVSVPHGPPPAGQPLARTADPRPLLARVQESLAQYRHAAKELADERIDGETFRRRTQGLRVGMVVDGEAVWLYDAEHERWVYCDGTRLSTYAASAGPGRPSGAPAGAGAAEADPTQVVAPEQLADPRAPDEDDEQLTQIVRPEQMARGRPPDEDDEELTQIVHPERMARDRPPDEDDEELAQIVRPVDESGPPAAHPPTRAGDG
ncbi:hypothetical protein [Streptomyces sp. NPDC053726]|uniref:hypothetical protein n=1 Tax=Streptomyces sp. NPDC053726 TaxID=3365713 RepID=UPI0037D84D4F